MPPVQRAFLIIFACIALFVSGCGGDSSGSTSASGGETTSSREKAEAIEEEFEEQEEAEAKKVEKEGSEARKAAEAEAGELPKPNVPSGPAPKDLVIEDVKQGSGPAAKVGDEVTVHYVGVLFDGGELFDSNWKGDKPFSFNLGKGEVIKGWDQGLPGMKVGGRRELIVPPELGYGSEGIYPSIPPNATLVFLVELLRVK
jgi:peptidylprolyl isomerase